MKNLYPFIVLIILTLSIFSCKKDKPNTTEAPEVPVTIKDSSFDVVSATMDDLNEFNIAYQVLPPGGETYKSIYLQWSTSPDFVNDTDSVLLADSIRYWTKSSYMLKGLKESKTYYSRLKVTYKKNFFYSSSLEFKTDSFKLLLVFSKDTYPTYAERGGVGTFVTNLKPVLPIQNSDTKIYLGDYLCPIFEDRSQTILVRVPSNIPHGTYGVRVMKNGYTVQTPDSVIVRRGIWSKVTPPTLPEGAITGRNTLGFYGTCYNAQKGYIVSGRYRNHLSAMDSPIDINYINYILEFDGLSKTWTKKFTVNQKNFEEPHCFINNNAIYVIGGREQQNSSTWPIKNTWKLNLSTLTWTPMDAVPHQNIAFPFSFEINGEWYIGSGLDTKNLDGNGNAIPSNKMWKYNPSTNVWSRIADFPGKYQQYPTTYILNNKAYLFSGYIKKAPYHQQYIFDYEQELWEYNPSSDSWAQVSLPAGAEKELPVGEKYSIITHNGKAIFLSARSYKSDFIYYWSISRPLVEFDPVTGKFEKISFHGLYPAKLFYKNGNKFYLQSDALGDYTWDNETYELEVD